MCEEYKEKDIRVNEKGNWVDLSELPRRREGIDWTESARQKCKIKFRYDDIKGEIEIIKYNKNGQMLTISYENNLYNIKSANLIKSKLGNIVGKITSDFKIEIGTHFKDNKRDLIIIDRNKLIKDYGYQKYNKKQYKYQCNKCGYNEGLITEKDLINGVGCACCCPNPQVVVEGINDIPTTAPWMVKFFQGGYNEAKMYTKCSHYKINPVCCDCGKVKEKPLTIIDLYINHSIGCACGDGFSYNERLIFALLEQLNIKFETQYSPIWIKPKRYDFYFKLEDKEYIIEADGEWHYKDNNMSGQTKEESQSIDNYKDRLAEKHDIQVKRINCEISNLDLIKKDILLKLNDIFDLSKIDWLKCEEFACSNLCKKICEYWNNKKEWETTRDLIKKFKLDRNTIIKYLKQGNQIGWCTPLYNPKEEMKKSGENSKVIAIKETGKRVEVFKDGISLGIFSSCGELERKSKDLFGIKLYQGCISLVCNGKQKQHNGYYFRFVVENNQQSA